MAFQLALNFFYLPTAVVTWPIARALLQLSRLHQAEDRRRSQTSCCGASSLPRSSPYRSLPYMQGWPLRWQRRWPSASSAAADGNSRHSLASLSLGVVGETWFILGTYAFYARQDVRSPVRSMAVRVGVTLSLMAVAWLSQGPSVLVILGLALSVGSLVGAADIGRRLREAPRGEVPLLRSLIRTVLASLVTVAVARATLWALRGLPDTKPAQLVTVSVAVLVGAAVFLAVQAAWRAPELGWLRSGLARGARQVTGDRSGAAPGALAEPRRHHGRRRHGRGGVPSRGVHHHRGLPPPRGRVGRLRDHRRGDPLSQRRRLRAHRGDALIAGMDRGLVIPVLRPNEAILALVAAGLVVRGVIRAASGPLPRPTVNSTDLSILLLAVTSSVVPLAWLAIRGAAIGQDDVLYALMVWKYFGVYLVARAGVRTERQVYVCLWIAMAAASVVAVVAVLQSLQLFGVARALATYYAPYGSAQALLNNRGGSTLALPIAVADLMALNLAIAVGLLVRGRGPRWLLAALGMLFMVGVLASGQFSGAIGLFLGLLVMALITRRVRQLILFVPALIGAMFAFQPVIQRRLEGFETASGLPVSWSGRLYNLSNYFWPELFSSGHFLLGVRPAARVATSTMATGYIWIESGYTWLLWAGGIPLLLSFLYFSGRTCVAT